jgi:hypothetical protein
MGDVVYFNEEFRGNDREYAFFFNEYLVLTTQTTIQQVYEESEFSLPLSLFQNKISPLRLIVKYLHEEKKLRINQIGKLLSRKDQVIWTSYNAVKTSKLKFSCDYFIPISIFSDTSLSVSEALVNFLKKHYSYSKIARLMLKDPRTIWTLQDRANKKLKKE